MSEFSKIHISAKLAGFDLFYRGQSRADKRTIELIFKSQVYKVDFGRHGAALLEYHRTFARKPSLIIDAGANIGAASSYFLSAIENVVVFAVEPEHRNFRLLQANTQSFPNKFNFHGGISGRDGQMKVADPGIGEWGYQTKMVEGERKDGTNIVPCISPASILAHPATRGTKPLILKVDIEGAEEYLFQGDCSWMAFFPLVIIELHDWLCPFSGGSRNFLRALASHDFDVVPRGENLFLFNRPLLRAYC